MDISKVLATRKALKNKFNRYHLGNQPTQQSPNRTKDVPYNAADGEMENNSDNATIYAGIVIAIIILIVIALMVYLSRKRVSVGESSLDI